MNQDIGIGGARHRYGNGADPTAKRQGQTIILMPLGAEVLEMKIAWLVRTHRPLCGDRPEIRGRCRKDGIRAGANSKDVGVSSSLIACTKLRRQLKPCGAA